MTTRPRLLSHRTLGLACLFALSLLTARCVFVGEGHFLFLVWNLFLALIPVFVVALPGQGKVTAAMRFSAWLLFFPNGPYLMTDLLHLRPRPGVPLWFDVGMLCAFAWAGLHAACHSLRSMHHRVSARCGSAAGWGFALLVTLLSGFGIWLGRFLRLNSWDVVTAPAALFGHATAPLLHPIAHMRAWGVTALFGGLLFVVYAAFVDGAESPRREARVMFPSQAYHGQAKTRV